jgi:hypothetical protein
MAILVSKEVREGILAVRDTGRTNMFDADAVKKIAYELGYEEAVDWIENHEGEYVVGIFEGFEVQTAE